MNAWPFLGRVIDLATSRAAAIMLWLVCVALILLDAWGLSLFRGSPNYEAAGTWGSWVASAASLVAVTVALWGNQMTHARYLADKREKDDREYTEVSAWTEYSVDESGLACLDLVIRNKTGHPVQQWSVAIASVGTLDSADLGPITPDDNRFSLDPPTEPSGFASLPCTLAFTDRIGRAWRADPAGGKQLAAEEEAR